jgi:hypothetical protein
MTQLAELFYAARRGEGTLDRCELRLARYFYPIVLEACLREKKKKKKKKKGESPDVVERSGNRFEWVAGREGREESFQRREMGRDNNVDGWGVVRKAIAKCILQVTRRWAAWA